MIIYLGTIICGILIANEVFNFHMSSSLGLVLTHLILGRLAIITMFIHLGLHLDRIFKKVEDGLNILYDAGDYRTRNLITSLDEIDNWINTL